MTEDKALDLAQEALKLSSVTVDSFGVQRKIQEAITAITAIKQARSAPVQEPVAWKDLTYGNLHHQDFGNSIPLYTTPPAPVVPDVMTTAEGEHPEYVQGWNDCRQLMLQTSQQRPVTQELKSARSAWVGLTDEDREDAWRNALHEAAIGESTATKCFARAIEAKLKEKNT